MWGVAVAMPYVLVVNGNWIWYNRKHNPKCIGRFYIWITMLFIDI